MDPNSQVSSPGGLFLPKRPDQPYRSRKAGQLTNPDVTERLRYAQRGGFRTGTAIDALPDLLIVFDESLKSAVQEGLSQYEAIEYADSITRQYGEAQLSSPLSKIQIRAMAALMSVDQRKKELQSMNGQDFHQSALYPTSVPQNSSMRSGPSASVTGVMDQSNTRMGALVSSEGPQDPSQTKFAEITSSTLNKTFRLRKAIADGQGGFKPAPGFFFDVLFFELAEQARGGRPGSIVSQAGFRLSDEEGNVFADFKIETPSSSPALEQPTNVDFGD